MAERLLRANRTLLLVPAVTINGVVNLVGGTPAAPILEPFPGYGDTVDAAILNTWQAVYTNANPISASGGNISCATLDDVELGLSDSDTDDELTVCSIGNEVTPTLYNVNANFTFLRDEDEFAVGVFNLAFNLVKSAELHYVIVDRVQGERPNTAVFADGDVIHLYEVHTDNPVDVTEDQGSIKIQQTFVPTGLVAQDIRVAA